jgi:hypothetical protein
MRRSLSGGSREFGNGLRSHEGTGVAPP